METTDYKNCYISWGGRRQNFTNGRTGKTLRDTFTHS